MEKTLFVKDDGIFCCTKTFFELKNTLAEFQEIVNKVFGSRIGRNMEVYVDDIILKFES